MSDNNLDLITELISGRLSPDEQQAALERVAADPELQSEYESQLAVSSLLKETPPATMTAAERSELRSALRQQLHLDDAPAPVVAAPSRWQRWWAPVAGLAAAAAVVVGVVVVLPDGGSDDSLQFAAEEVTTTIQASGNDGADIGGSVDAAVGSAEAQTTTTAAASQEAVPSAAADDGTLEAAGEAPPDALPYVPEANLDELALAYAEGAEEFESELNKSSAVPEPRAAFGAGTCLGEVEDGTDEAERTILATGTIDEVEVIFVAVVSPTEEPYLVALDASSCAEVASTRP